MNREKLQEILYQIKYRNEQAIQGYAVVSDRNYEVEILEAILEEPQKDDHPVAGGKEMDIKTAIKKAIEGAEKP